MFRWMSGLAALVLVCGGVSAAQIKGSVVKVDAEKAQIVLKVDGKEQTFDIKKGAKVYTLGRKMMEVTITLSEVKVGAAVTANTDKEGGKEVLTFVKVEQVTPKKKRKK